MDEGDGTPATQCDIVTIQYGHHDKKVPALGEEYGSWVEVP